LSGYERAERFMVSLAYGKKWRGQFQRTGQMERVEQRRGTPRKLLDQPREQLRHWLIAVPHLSLDQLQQKRGEDCGVQISRAQVASQDLRGRLFAEWDTKREES
jgi:transposase